MRDAVSIKNLAQYPVRRTADVTIGAKYQIVIPKEARIKAIKIKPGSKVRVTPIDDYSVNIKVKPTMEEWIKSTKGIAKGLWGNKPDKYLRDLRHEWDK